MNEQIKEIRTSSLLLLKYRRRGDNRGRGIRVVVVAEQGRARMTRDGVGFLYTKDSNTDWGRPSVSRIRLVS